MDNSIYQNNLAALRKRDVELYEKIAGLCGDGGVETFESRSGVMTLKVNDLFFHSAYDPLREADYFLEDVDLKYCSEGIIIIGLGLGYHAKKLWENPYLKGKMLIIEKNLFLFRAALMASDWTSLIKSPMVSFVIEDDAIEACRKIEKVRFFKIDLTNVGIVVHPASSQFYLEYYLEISKKIRAMLGFMRGSFGAFKTFQERWVKNAMEDIIDVASRPGISALKDSSCGLPAIIVSAGPSLDHDIETLRSAKGKIPIFAVGTAYRALLNHGIEPDFVVVVDAHEIILKQFEDIHPNGTYLFAANFIRKEIIDKFMPNVFFYFNADNPFHILLPESQRDKGRVFAGGSVAHSAVDLAVKIGFNPIVLVGQDLSFASKDKMYANGSVYQDRKIDYTDDEDFKKKRLLWVKGNYTDTVLSYQSFHVFICSFEKYIKTHPDTEFINATAGGAYLEGTKLMRLDEVLAQYGTCDQMGSFMRNIRAAQDSFAPDWEGFRRQLEEAQDRYRSIVEDLETGHEKAKKFKALLEEGKEAPEDIRSIPADLVELGKRLDGDPFVTLLEYGKGYFMYLNMSMNLKLAPDVKEAHKIFCNSVEEVYRGLLDSAQLIKHDIEGLLNKGELWSKTESIK